MAKPPPKTNVNVPIKIWIGRDVDGPRLSDNVASTSGNQLGRALNILDERGEWEGYLGRLDIQFKGGAATLPDQRKRQIRAYVGDGLAKGTQVAQAHRVKGGTRKQGGKPGTETKKPPPKKKGVKLKKVADWIQFSGMNDPRIQTALDQAATDWLIEKGQREFPTTYGILLRLQGQAAVQLWVIDSRRTVCWVALTVLDWSEEQPRDKAKADRPDPFKLYLKREDNGFDEWRESALTNRSNQRAAALGKGGEVKFQQAGVDEAQRKWSAEVEKVVDEYMKGWETSIRVYYWLYGMGERTLYPFRQDRFPELPTHLPHIDLVALADIREEEVLEGEEEEEGADGLVLPKLPDSSGGGDGGKGEGGGGEAGKGQGLGSDVTAPPGQDVGKGGRGIVVSATGTYDPKASPFMDTLQPAGESSALECEPYKDEPPFYELPTGAEQIRHLIDRIAARLDMPSCPYPANFCIQAARMVRIRASQVHSHFAMDVSGNFSAELSVGTFDRAGNFRFRGIDSIGVQYLQHLAGTIPRIRELMELVRTHTYPVTTFGPHHWFQDVMDEATQACGFIWLLANQIMMQQLLKSSELGVRQRKANPEYARVFAVLCKTRLADQAEMVILRTSLEKFLAIVGDRKGDDAREHLREHLTIQTGLQAFNTKILDVRTIGLLEEGGLDADLMTRLSDRTDYVFRRGKSGEAKVTDAGSIIEDEGKWKIRGSDGELYDKDELNTIVELGQKVVSSIDPLMNQVLNRLVSEIPPLVDNPEKVPGWLDELFTAMLTKNYEVSVKNKGDYEYAFEHAQIHKVDRDTPPTVELAETQMGPWQLSGIHALAHLHVGVRFEGDAFYTAAVSRLVGQEYYWRSFVEDMVFIFGTALTIICPPLGMALSFVANLALGLEKHAKASEQEDIYGALLNPEDVLSYAEIQIDLFLAKLQIALSFLEVIPYGGKGVKALAGLGKKAATQGAKKGLGKIAKAAVMEELERIAKTSAESFVKALAIELAEEAIEDKIVDALLTPVIEAHIKQIQAELREEGR